MMLWLVFLQILDGKMFIFKTYEKDGKVRVDKCVYC